MYIVPSTLWSPDAVQSPPKLLPPRPSILLSSDTPVYLNGWLLVIGICVSIYSNILISQRSYCSSDSSLTWKLSVIMAPPFLFYSFLHNSLLCAASIYALNVTSLCVLDNYVGSSSLRLSLNQYINDVNRFCWSWVTVNLLASGVLLAYPLQAYCIPSASLTLRWTSA